MFGDGRLCAGVAGALVAGLFAASPVEAREIVPFGEAMRSGTLVIRTSERRLYYVNGDGTAIRYPVAVGRPGMQWSGLTAIDGKHYRPAWSPPWEVRRDHPRMPDVIRAASKGNPMGVAAMTLRGGEYAIHGTNKPSSIGTFASYGCIRMYNKDISDLIERVEIGTPVYVMH